MHGRERVLIVDGRAAIRGSMLHVCRRIGLSATTASSWPEARVELQARYYDLVILSLNLRGH
jgi:DNA-binding response OmpR family regulator